MGSLEPRLEPPAAERPYWHFNCPASESTEECPPFLQSASEYDKMQLSILDSDYSIMSWPVLCNIIAENKLNHLRRVPSELRKYFEFRYRVLQKYGSMMEFILTKLLKWEEPIVAEAAPFKCERDIKILYNHWPYGIDKKVVHLVVWTKFDLEDDPTTDDLTPQARQEIETYVDETFRKPVGKDNVIWFKNWSSLKSVHAVEHFHVMLYDPPATFITDITGGDAADGEDV